MDVAIASSEWCVANNSVSSMRPEFGNDFTAQSGNGDLDGDGENVFPPVVGDVVDFALLGIDKDDDGSNILSCTHPGGWSWTNQGPKTPNGYQTQEPLIFVDANGQIPAQ